MAQLPPAARISFTALFPTSATKMLPLASTATPSGLLKPLPSVAIAQLKCAVCASAEGANPPGALRHRAIRARTHMPQRTQLSLRGRLSKCRSPRAATRLLLEITWEVAQDETREGSRADENSIAMNLLMKKCIQQNEKQLHGRASQCKLSLHGCGQRPKSGRRTGRGLQRNNTGKNYLAVVHLYQLTLNRLIETLPHVCHLSVYSGRLPISGKLLYIAARRNERKELHS